MQEVRADKCMAERQERKARALVKGEEGTLELQEKAVHVSGAPNANAQLCQKLRQGGAVCNGLDGLEVRQQVVLRFPL